MACTSVTAIYRPWLRSALLSLELIGQHTSRTRNKSVKRISTVALRADILDKLGEYEIYIQRLRRHDRSAYTQYRRIGAYVLDNFMKAHGNKIEPFVVARPPAFGAIAFLNSKQDDVDAPSGWIGVRFMYFTKLERPGSRIERSNVGPIYTCTVYWDNKKALTKDSWAKTDHGASADFAIAVAPDGSVYPLRVLQHSHQEIRHKHVRRGERSRSGPYSSMVTHQRWGLPDIRGDREIEQERSLAETIRTIFCIAMNFWATAARSSMIRVTASKGPVVMPFVVDVLNTPQFFADRDATITVNGRRARIFHLVRAHTRTNARTGALVKVPIAFRGLRQFDWHGYRVDISVPGKDTLDLADATFGAVMPEDDEPITPDLIELAEFAEKMADAIHAPAPPDSPA